MKPHSGFCCGRPTPVITSLKFHTLSQKLMSPRMLVLADFFSLIRIAFSALHSASAFLTFGSVCSVYNMSIYNTDITLAAFVIYGYHFTAPPCELLTIAKINSSISGRKKKVRVINPYIIKSCECRRAVHARCIPPNSHMRIMCTRQG